MENKSINVIGVIALAILLIPIVSAGLFKIYFSNYFENRTPTIIAIDKDGKIKKL